MFALEYHLERLRNTEVLIIICVLLLWCGSIWIFIRHSELLRIRYRHIPYNPTIKSQTNLSHINVVHRLSDTIIHAKPTSTSATTLILTHPLSNRMSEQGSTYERKSLLVPQTCNVETNVILCDSNPSIKCTDTDDQLLDPHMIPRDVRRRLLDVHRKSVGNLSGMRYSISFPSHDLSIQ